MPPNARPDSDTLKVLEAVRPVWERLREERIRTDHEIKRCERDHREAEAKAVETFGTSDEGQIRTMIEERRAANASQVDDFVAQVRQIERDLAELDRQPA